MHIYAYYLTDNGEVFLLCCSQNENCTKAMPIKTYVNSGAKIFEIEEGREPHTHDITSSELLNTFHGQHILDMFEMVASPTQIL